MHDRADTPPAPTPPSRVGAVIFVTNVERTAAFYAALLEMPLVHSDAEHAVLEGRDFEMIVHAIPAEYAASIVIATPPEPREDTPIKLVWTVESLDRCADVAVHMGGRLFDNVWTWRGFRMRHGCDPEGNLFQLRELER
jgi:predicted enzyme related to lactoylglutathione lyase